MPTSFFVADRCMTASWRYFRKCKLRKSLDGNIRSGTYGALSIELLARCVSSLAARNKLMDQVGFEPTSSRVTGEVTLPFTTSNLVSLRKRIRVSAAPARTAGWFAIRAGQTLAGRNSRSELRSNCAASCVNRSNSFPRHPGISFQWEQTVRVFF